jgi:beta-glucosidase
MAFPEGFWWGSGSSDAALRGAAPGTELARWEQEARVAPSGDGAGWAASFAEDLERLAAAGLRQFRLPLEWARLEPVEGRRDVDEVEHLRLVLGAARSAGVEVWGCLHDDTLPGWFAHDERGFADARSRGYFWSRHVEAVGEDLGDLVHGWVPVFEPNRWAARGWLDGSRPPGGRDDAKGYAAALEGVHLASVTAALRLREGGRPVASAPWVVPAFPARPDPQAPVPAEAAVACSVVDEVLWGCWQRMVDEEVLVVPGRSPVPVPGARTAFDVIGFTYRHAVAVRGDGALLPYPPGVPVAADGRAVFPEGLQIALHRVAEAFGDRPVLVAGYGLDTVHEERREAYVRDGLEVVADAIDGGIDVRGLWWDTPFDPASVPGGSAPGLWSRDRRARPAADLLAAVARGGDVPAA